ncbi:hypothetical protein COOONC_08044 [Cooperia oncophora]
MTVLLTAVSTRELRQLQCVMAVELGYQNYRRRSKHSHRHRRGKNSKKYQRRVKRYSSRSPYKNDTQPVTEEQFYQAVTMIMSMANPAKFHEDRSLSLQRDLLATPPRTYEAGAINGTGYDTFRALSVSSDKHRVHHRPRS